MLHGQRVTLRPVRATDVDTMYAAHTNIRNRGSFFPRGVVSETKSKSQFAEHGYWEREEGMLVIESPGRSRATSSSSGRSATGMRGSCPTFSMTIGSPGRDS